MTPTRLRQLRRDKGLTQLQIATDIGISVGVYQRYDNGTRKLPSEIAAKLANYYGVSVDYLLGRTDIPNSAPPAHDRIDITDEAQMAYLIQQMGISADKLPLLMDYCAYLKRGN